MALYAKRQPILLNVNRIPSQPKKRKKIILAFDEKKRREFLTGFRKRKVERQKKAHEEIERRLKEERKRIKQTTQERCKNLLSSRDVPEIQELLSQHEYETEGHTVSILELNVADFAEQHALIGENKGTNESDDEEQEDKDNSDNNDEIEGMTLNGSEKSSQQITKNIDLKSGTDLKKAIRKATLQEVKKSKTYKQKEKFDSIKNKKKSLRKLRKLQKAQKQHSGKLKKKSKH